MNLQSGIWVNQWWLPANQKPPKGLPLKRPPGACKVDRLSGPAVVAQLVLAPRVPIASEGKSRQCQGLLACEWLMLNPQG